MRALALVAICLTACAHATPPISRATAQRTVTIPSAPVPVFIPTQAATSHEVKPAPLDVLGWLHQRERMLSSSSWTRDIWTCGTAMLPGRSSWDGLRYEDTPRLHRVPKPLGRVSVSRVRGPSQLDAELAAVTAPIRSCYRRANESFDATPSLLLTVLERTTSSLLVADVYPRDAARDLIACVSRALIDALVNPLGSIGPMKIGVTVSPASDTPPY